MVTPAQAGLEVAQHGVDPLESGQVLGLSCADDGRLMHASGRADGGKAGQPVGEHGAARRQAGLGPLPDGLEAEAGDEGEFNAQRMAVIAERDGDDERDLVLRATTDLAAATLTAQVGIIDLYLAFEDITRLALGHRTHQLVVDQPGRGIAHPQVSHQRERRQPGLGLADKVDREKPDAQGQFAALHHGARDQRGLMPTGLALKKRMGSSAHPAVGGPIAARTTKPGRPARVLQGRRALRLGTVAFEKCGHRQAGLKLNSVHCHGSISRQIGCIYLHQRT